MFPVWSTSIDCSANVTFVCRGPFWMLQIIILRNSRLLCLRKHILPNINLKYYQLSPKITLCHFSLEGTFLKFSLFFSGVAAQTHTPPKIGQVSTFRVQTPLRPSTSKEEVIAEVGFGFSFTPLRKPKILTSAATSRIESELGQEWFHTEAPKNKTATCSHRGNTLALNLTATAAASSKGSSSFLRHTNHTVNLSNHNLLLKKSWIWNVKKVLIRWYRKLIR